MYFLIPREISKTGKQMIILPEELELANQHRHCQLGSPWSHVRAGNGDGSVGRFRNRAVARVGEVQAASLRAAGRAECARGPVSHSCPQTAAQSAHRPSALFKPCGIR